MSVRRPAAKKSWCSDCQAVELWPENLASADLYIACETQWLRAGMDGTPTGLNYPGGNSDAVTR